VIWGLDFRKCDKICYNIEANGLCVHLMPATAATDALSIETDIAKCPGMARPRKCLHNAVI
jgi:hypothetical protein